MSEIDPADIAAVPKRSVPEPITPVAVEIARDPDRARPEREGLPPGYRMRADAHYVDQLTSRRVAKSHLDDARAAPREQELPGRDPVADAREGRDARDRHTELLLTSLSESLATMESAAAVLAGETSAMARRVSLDLIRAHAWREKWLLRAHAILQGLRPPQLRPRPLGFVLDQVRAGFAAECRLTGVRLHVHASDWNAVVPIDEWSLVAGVAGAVFATLGVLDGAEGATMTVGASSVGRELRAIDVIQDAVVLTAGAAGRFFDAAWTDRPGGWAAGWAALVAQAVARQHGGEAIVLTPPRGGSAVRLQLTGTE